VNCLCERPQQRVLNTAQKGWLWVEVWQLQSLELKSFTAEIRVDKIFNAALRDVASRTEGTKVCQHERGRFDGGFVDYRFGVCVKLSDIDRLQQLN